MTLRLRIKWGDLLISALVLILAGVIAFAFYGRSTGAQLVCEIEQNGEIVRTIPLDGHTETVTITGETVTNVIEIAADSVCFAQSDCPDQVCVRTGILTRAGQMAVCLPNRVIVRLTGGAETPAVDAIVQ